MGLTPSRSVPSACRYQHRPLHSCAVSVLFAVWGMVHRELSLVCVLPTRSWWRGTRWDDVFFHRCPPPLPPPSLFLHKPLPPSDPQASLFGDPPKYHVVVQDVEFFQRAATSEHGLPPQLASLLERMNGKVRTSTPLLCIAYSVVCVARALRAL